MNDSLSSKTATKKSSTAFRLGASVVALVLGPLALGCTSNDFGESESEPESVGTISEAVQLAGTATASSAMTGMAASSAVDGNAGTRWESVHGVDPQWLRIDLGTQKQFDRVVLNWEGAFATGYSIQQSNDGTNFTNLFSTTTGDGGTDDITGLAGNARYVRMNGTVRGSPYGYSLWEMQVHSNASTGTCFKIRSQRSATTGYLYNNAGLVSLGGTVATAEIFEKIPNGGGFQFKARSTNTMVGYNTGTSDLSVNGVAQTFTEYDCSSGGTYPNGKGYASATGTGRNWKANSLTGPVDTYNGGNGGNCVAASATAWERFYLEGASCPSGGSCTPTTCASAGKNCGSITDGCGGTLNCGTCSSGQTCSASNVCQASCTPTTCAAQGKNCGSISNGCGGTLNCGTCGSGQACSTANVCEATAGCASNDLTTATNLVNAVSSGAGGPAFDNNATSRWESTHGVDPQWIQVDLGASKFVNRVNITWEAANARDYSVRISNDVNFGTFSTLVTKTGMGTGNRTDDLTGLSGSGRYVRLHGTARNLNYGYSVYEMNVYGDNNASCSGGGSCTPTTCAAQGKNCGSLSDGCGGTLNCGTCGSGSTCSANVCQASSQPCGGACTAGQTCNLSNQCVTEGCGGGCGMGQKCVSNACTNDLTAGAGYYNAGKSLETIPGGFFGPNVRVYKHDSDQAAIGTDLTNTYNEQRDAQFATIRDGILFAPGSYTAGLLIGFNTQIAGLGDHPDTVVMSGQIGAWAPSNMGNNGTQTFWRVLENFKSTAIDNWWAVSQAAPMRRVHAMGKIGLSYPDCGWVSGGFISDTRVEGELAFCSQQQFYVRNSHTGNATGGVWNIMLQGVTGTKAQALFAAGGPLTDIANSPKVREKPFLYVNRDGLFKVFVPALRTNAVGPSWTTTSGGAGTSIPLSSFHVTKEGVDTATTMNNALAAGKHLLITPGVYFLDATLQVNNANTVVLGIGLATLTPNNGVNAINVADVDGVKLAGILIDAGTGNTDTLLQVGPAGSNADHTANPTSIHDIFTRIGGRGWIAKAKKNVVVNSRNVILDHTWIWRADHGDGVGWTLNTSANGLIVNGSDVISYGMHVEHFQEYQVKWNGNNGRNYFFQNELAYEAPNQNDYNNPPAASEDNVGVTHGYASYKVANTVTNHEFHGGGCYAVFLMNDCTTASQCASGVCAADGKCTAPNPIMQADRCIETPTGAGIIFRNLVAQTFSDKGKINNLFNADGRVTAPGQTAARVAVP